MLPLILSYYMAPIPPPNTPIKALIPEVISSSTCKSHQNDSDDEDWSLDCIFHKINPPPSNLFATTCISTHVLYDPLLLNQLLMYITV